MASNAVSLANFGSGIGTQGAVLQVDNTNNRLGVGTTNPQSTMQVGTGITMDGFLGQIRTTGVITASSCLLYTSPSPRDAHESRMPSSA